MSQLEQYLAFYEKRANPGYAVLITGAWGVGKTFQVKRALRSSQTCYVSLFGLQSPKDIYEAAFAKMFPEVAQVRDAAQEMGSMSIGGFSLGGLPSQIVNMFVREQVDNTKILILDDLERCSVSPVDLLGVVNRYVEHHGCRVVVIAHDGKLSDELKGQKEKVFGQVIRARPEIASAFEKFTQEFGTPGSEDWLNELRDDILTAFKESEVESLRILRHVVEDLNRLWGAASSTHHEQRTALNELGLLFVAWSFERRAERIARADLAKRSSVRFTHALASNASSEAVAHPAITAMSRYSMAPMESQVIPDELLQRILFDSIFDSQEIQAALNQSAYFAAAENLPSWRVFIDFGRRDDAEADRAMREMMQQFQDRSVKDPGDMLHHFALRMMMSKWQLIGETIDDVKVECFQYIDDLFSGDMLNPAPMSHDLEDSLSHGASGYAFWVEEESQEQFKAVFNYLRDRRQEAMIRRLPDEVPEVLSAVATDADELQRLLLYTGDGQEPKFDGKPILSAIDVDAFVRALLSSHPENWQKVTKVLHERRRHDLEGEEAWCQEFGKALNQEAEIAVGIRKVRVTRLAHRYSQGR